MATIATKFGVGQVVAAGFLAGLIFAVFEMIAAAVLNGPQAAFMPLRMIGAMALGAEALDPGYSILVAGSAGMIVHFMLSIVFALLFALVVSPTATPGTLALIGIGFGTLLWLVNFYVIAPMMGWTWFPERTNAIVQFLAHAFFFGCVVGWTLARSRTVIVHAP